MFLRKLTLCKCPFSDAGLKHKDIGQQSSVAKNHLLFQVNYLKLNYSITLFARESRTRELLQARGRGGGFVVVLLLLQPEWASQWESCCGYGWAG